jgi:hypothetical protein
MNSGARTISEASEVQFGHGFMKVQNKASPKDTTRKRREDESVRERVNVDDTIPAKDLQHDEPDQRQEQKQGILIRVPTAGAAHGPEGQAVRFNRSEPLLRSLPDPLKAKDVDLEAAAAEGFHLTSDPRVCRKLGIREVAHATSATRG